MRSVRRNPVIADLFHRMKYMERRGSGLRKIVSETEKLPGYREELKPEFFSTSCDFKVVLKNINYHQDNHQGSGLRKIVSETEKLPGYREELKPEFFSTSCDFKVVLKNINYHQDNHQDNHQDRNVTSQKVTEFCTEPKSIKEIIEFFGYKDRRSFNLLDIKIDEVLIYGI